ncbi:uncharacterized protein MAM_06069 [Metarhizium album ARSEF 1941]|uniref:DUF7514 domain-containing protein n=1 Tax=Metarhizium album (strain ARSEF 1941) TaxID=1081103 RepID=A0A0B2WQP5_METAS|nr:uncharacterized protein MAM_06069 [Metarhizium album ARSEF 1941]KHN95964.1 hypothetical protein MAM_06069 [Metarhizium album ARSEF 1941]
MTSPSSDASPDSAVQYAYMFEKNKGPTKQLDALLRAIARHVMLEIGEKTDNHLTPSKLAAFYKAVGGDYDALFVDTPHSTISYLWQITGCQHSLQPTGNDFDPPSIPALTYRGFSRWESLEILLGPEEHVPFLQFAVKRWNLKHPETGADFPVDLPWTCFPERADQDIDRWHKSCADKLWMAASNDDGATPKPSPANEQPPPPKFTYAHFQEPFSSTSSPRSRPSDGDYYGRPMSYSHVPRRYATQREPERSPDRPRRGDTPPDDRERRRRSFSDYGSGQPDTEPPLTRGYSPTYFDANMKKSGAGRRHSHPRHEMADPSDDEPVGDPREKRRRHPSPPPPPSVRRFVRAGASSQSQGSANGSSNLRPLRPDGRPDEAKRRTGPSPLGSLRDRFTETVSSILPNGLTSDRPRSGSRQNSGTESIRMRRSREQVHSSRLSRSYSDMDTDESEDNAVIESDGRRRRRPREERERERERDRERHQRGRLRHHDRDWEEDRDVDLRRDKVYLRRPETQRRTSSHADIDRKRDPPEWDPRDRDRDRDRDRLRDERRKWERRISPEEDFTGPAAAMAARRTHPEPAYS